MMILLLTRGNEEHLGYEVVLLSKELTSFRDQALELLKYYEWECHSYIEGRIEFPTIHHHVKTFGEFVSVDWLIDGNELFQDVLDKVGIEFLKALENEWKKPLVRLTKDLSSLEVFSSALQSEISSWEIS